MKKRGVFLILIACTVCTGWSAAGAEEFRDSWTRAEKEYSAEYLRKLEAENRREYIKMFFDLGKEYFESEDYPAALVSFKRVVGLEAREKEKEFTVLAGKYIETINNRLMEQVEQQCSDENKKDLARLEKGITELIAQKPVVTYEPEIEEIVEGEDLSDVKIDEIEKIKEDLLVQKEEIEKDKELMKLKLRKEILNARKDIEKVLFDKKKKEVETDRKARERLIGLRELYQQKQYEETVREADVILGLDPDLREAKKIRMYAQKILDKQRASEEKESARREKEAARQAERERKKRDAETARENREREAQRKQEEALQKKRREQEEAARKKRQQKAVVLLKEAEKELLAEKYVKAGNLLQEVLSLDPDNQTAHRFLEYIQVKIRGFSVSPDGQ